MKKQRTSHPTKTGAFTVTLGRGRFAKISAVEGIKLTSGMKERAADSERRGLSGDERRREILQAYRKK